MTDLQVILDKLQEMTSDMKDIKADVAELKTDVAELKTDVAELKTRQDKAEKRLEAIFEQTAGLMEFRQTTEKILGQILEQQVSLVHIVGEHEVYIRTLQRRIV
ncbi:Hypothetical protein DEACI_1065 [Acididesulfobacillus acetoxydans]|uniref:Uncharacterized protein n=1 Tax=Acididesulfobacillus acetoxydans TaxID=1561005 RepID=A0A8S0WES7_9FIRM|nr:hypothetical protein [Acididesulfobacillus acetoxydans]CAA7600412.1 Hypothetical protein DEACI_1065 [Acididesulfobacillus acetoxydans]CEJ06546.1 Hypothetical protein DEACI_0994 [Acididesulfobacillus acetoxydans]